MPKIQKTQAPVIQRKTFSQEEINRTIQEAHGDFSDKGRIRWLLTKNSIKLKTRPVPVSQWVKEESAYTDMSVVQLSDGSFPYSTFSALWDATVYHLNKKDFAKREQDRHYDKIATQELLTVEDIPETQSLV